MEQITAIKPGSIWMHDRKKTTYEVLWITNQHSTDPAKFPLTVVYRDMQGRDWSRPVVDFLGSFTRTA